MKKLDFGFGNPYALNEVLTRAYQPSLSLSTNMTNLPYAPDIGRDKLVEIAREHIKNLTDSRGSYDYIMITHGATSALNTVLRYIKKIGETGITTLDFGYPFYEKMISKAGLAREAISHTDTDLEINNKIRSSVNKWALIDSPHNPSGNVYNINVLSKGIIWDATYHTKTYLKDKDLSKKPYMPQIIIGSFGKMLGITGIRLGFLATGNPFMFERLLEDNLMENATASHLGQLMIEDVYNQLDMDTLMLVGRDALDRNRAELSKLEKLTGTAVSENGMFYLFQADQKLVSIFNESDIIFTKFNVGSDIYIRLNGAQTLENTKEMVRRVLERDNV
jgi:aspartate/methionine/tyrosine aminotransferase